MVGRLSLPRIIVMFAVLTGLGVVAFVWLQPVVQSPVVTAVEPVHFEEPRTIDVRVLSGHRLRRFWIHSGECRTRERDGSRGPFDVQSVILRRHKIWLCPDPDVRRPDQERCEWAQRLELHCLEAPVLSAKDQAPRRYGRVLLLRIHRRSIRVISHIELERYIESVVMSEHAYAPFEARRVQAIVARTYALHAMEQPRHDDAPVCDTTHCQAFGSPIEAKSDEQAALTTKSVVLVDSNRKIAPTYFHSTCGGHTHDASDVWPGSTSKDIVGVSDRDRRGRAWCRNSPHFRWSYTLSARRLARALRKAVGRKLDARTLRLERRDDRGLKWRIRDRRGRKIVRGSTLHRTLGRALGFSKIKTAWFEVKRKKNKFYFEGRGLGHGVGLCQKGAEARAKAGQSAEDILQAYFPRLQLAHLDDVRPRE